MLNKDNRTCAGLLFFVALFFILVFVKFFVVFVGFFVVSDRFIVVFVVVRGLSMRCCCRCLYYFRCFTARR